MREKADTRRFGLIVLVALTLLGMACVATGADVITLVTGRWISAARATAA